MRKTKKRTINQAKENHGRGKSEIGMEDRISHGSIEVILNHDLVIPSCEHGPCLLFERYKRNGETIRFFACAVYRNRKVCPFFHRTDQKATGRLQHSSALLRKPQLTHKALLQRLREFKQLPESRRKFCFDCSSLVLPKEGKEHRGHKTENGISNKQLRNPSKLLPSLSENGKEAQFWFSRATLNVLVENLLSEALNADAVLCIGSPRLFEALRPHRHRLGSMLLDYDARFKQFWGPRKFAQFSMFVNHFYGKLGAKTFGLFLKKSRNLVVFVDPPFGGLVAPLAQTLLAIRQQHRELAGSEAKTNLFWVAPYFLGNRIQLSIPEMKMIHFVVQYENHGVYSRKSSAPNPSRLFSSLPLSAFRSPQDSEYKFCSACGHDVFSACVHCHLCGVCPSLDLGHSVHCPSCDRCVKSKYRHCNECGKCHLPGKCLSGPVKRQKTEGN